MPPRTGPRRRRRAKQAALPQRHFTIVHGAAWIDAVDAHRIELEGGHLVLRDHDDAIIQIVAPGRWQEIRQVTAANPAVYSGTDLEETDNAPGSGATDERIDSMQREEAILTPPTDPAVTSGTSEVTRGIAREQEDRRFVPSSPEEAQRILMEIERRLSPTYQDPPDASSQPPAALRPKE
jgi:hypothetical protein